MNRRDLFKLLPGLVAGGCLGVGEEAEDERSALKEIEDALNNGADIRAIKPGKVSLKPNELHGLYLTYDRRAYVAGVVVKA